MDVDFDVNTQKWKIIEIHSSTYHLGWYGLDVYRIFESQKEKGYLFNHIFKAREAKKE